MRNSILFFLLLSIRPAAAQMPPVEFDLPHYNFIHYDINRFELVDENPAYIRLFAKFDTLLSKGTNRIKIVHFGGSHIQDDIYTHRIRQEMQSFYPGILGSRGFFFPFKIAHTNSPSNLTIQYSGEWITNKNTKPDSLYALGVSGITTILTSDSGRIQIVARFDSLQHYDFNKIRIFCNAPCESREPEVFPSGRIVHRMLDTLSRYVEYELSGYTDTLNVLIKQYDSLRPFELYGISLENDDPGVIYNAIGVNGAMLKSYLACNLFNRQLAVLDPDWVIISIGTNEGNTRDFDEPAYRTNYLMLLDSVRKTVPDAAILLTVPNDSYLQKRYLNPNTARMRNVIFDIARKYGCGVWDFYSVMGGLNSAKAWYDIGLMNKDHIHFTKEGYLLQGDLFNSAFLTSWNDPSFSQVISYPQLPETGHQLPVTPGRRSFSEGGSHQSPLAAGASAKEAVTSHQLPLLAP
jgi:hypothetical protein